MAPYEYRHSNEIQTSPPIIINNCSEQSILSRNKRKRGYQLFVSPDRNVKMAANRVVGATRLGKKLFLPSALRTGFLTTRAGTQICIFLFFC